MSGADPPLVEDAEIIEPVLTFRDFIVRENPTLLRFEHIELLVEVGQNLVDTYSDAAGNLAHDWENWEPLSENGSGGLPETDDLDRAGPLVSPNWRRIIFLLPRRYFKSEVFSRLLSPYFLYRFPSLWVGLTSYEARQSQTFSRKARDRFRSQGGEMRKDSTAVGLWDTVAGGGLWAAGTGGPLLGKGYHLGICDDPIKPEHARSEVYQKRFEEWYPGTFVSGAEPGASRVIIMQRLDIADPIDFLFRREVGEGCDEAVENWHVVALDEVHSDVDLWRGKGPMGIPITCTLHPDPRSIGEVLAPSRFREDAVHTKHRQLGPAVTSSQMQQRPDEASGDFWKAEWMDDAQLYDSLEEICDRLNISAPYNGGSDWDTAFTKKETNSASAFVYSLRGPGGIHDFPIFIEDLGWNWYEFPALVNWIRSTRGPHYVEDKASGKSAIQVFRNNQILNVSGVNIATVDKFSRSAAVQPIVANRRVFIRKAIAKRLLRGEKQGLLRVTVEHLRTDSGYLDLNDAFTQALHRHGKPKDISFGKL